MGNLTAHFDVSEFEDVSTGPVSPIQALRLAYILEPMRAAGGGFPLRLTSYVRSKTKNTSVGGVENSQHLDGTAVDFVPVGVSLSVWTRKVLLAEQLGQIPEYGQFIIYPGNGDHVHVSLATRGKIRDRLVKTSPEPGAKPEFGRLSLAAIGSFAKGQKVLAAFVGLGILTAIFARG